MAEPPAPGGSDAPPGDDRTVAAAAATAASADPGPVPHAGPVHMPPSSYWPIVLAVGMAMALIGVITKYEVVAVGLLVSVVALIGWIRDARREYRSLS